MAKKKETTDETLSTAPTLDLDKWRKTGPEVRGTSCTCGAHSSAVWGDGGAEWLTAHVAETHKEAVDWPAVIRHALTLPDYEMMDYLRSLLPETE